MVCCVYITHSCAECFELYNADAIPPIQWDSLATEYKKAKLYEPCQCRQISVDVNDINDMRWRLFGHFLHLDEI